MWRELRKLDLPQLSQLPTKACGHISMKLQDPGEKKRKDVTFMPLPSALPYICYPRVPKACNWVPKSRPYTTLPMGPYFRKKLCMVVNRERDKSLLIPLELCHELHMQWLWIVKMILQPLYTHWQTLLSHNCSYNHNVALRINLANIH